VALPRGLGEDFAMASPDESADDVFWPGGGLRMELLSPQAADALQEAVRMARHTRWDSLRSPHIFMGLLAQPDGCVCDWGARLRADLPKLLDQFQELFHQDQGDPEPVLLLNREFLSDNVIRLLREAYGRSVENRRARVTPMDLLISLLSADNSIVAECFERIGISASTLTKLAMMAEQSDNVGRSRRDG
jgi:ATP-dependent Clp protease ATP-binding subunit ClpA